MIAADEDVLIKMKGAFKEILVCTDKRIIILKSGLQTGSWFGLNQFQIPLELVSSAEVNSGLMGGFFEISAVGVQNQPKGYWDGSAQKAANCVSIGTRADLASFREASNFIMEKAKEARSLARDGSQVVAKDVSESLMNLYKMKSDGALTEAEYEAAKAKMLM